MADTKIAYDETVSSITQETNMLIVKLMHSIEPYRDGDEL